MTSSVSSEEQQLFSKDNLVSQALSPPGDDKLNYFKFASIVLNEFPKALRQTFRSMWDNTFGHLQGHQTWDDSIVVRNQFLGKEGARTKVPRNLSYEKWDVQLWSRPLFTRGHSLCLTEMVTARHSVIYMLSPISWPLEVSIQLW